MYYNPQTKEMLEAENLKRRLNVSFPYGEECVMDWFLLHEEQIPHLLPGQNAVPDQIVCKNNQYVQTYKIADSSNDNSMPSIEERISALESGLAEIGRLLIEWRS